MAKITRRESGPAKDEVVAGEKETPVGIPLDGETSAASTESTTKSVAPETLEKRRSKHDTPERDEPTSNTRANLTNATKKVRRGQSPQKLTILSYQVGFGDCFLLSFEYAHGSRHVLIDCGTTGLPKDVDADAHMHQVTDDIVRRVGSEPFAVVATHRHRDHISGFATASNGKGTGDKLRGLKPELVIQPWTEDPKLAPNAKGPVPSSDRVRTARGFAAALHNMSIVAQAAADEAERLEANKLEGGVPLAIVRQLAFLGQNNLANASAVRNLMTMGTEQEYVNFGTKSGLEAFLPGVTTYVLGPPTLEQSAAIEKQRSKDSDEFWHLQAMALKETSGTQVNSSESGLQDSSRPPNLFPDSAHLQGEPPPYARWFVPRLRSLRATQMLELVRILDKAMNNTSVILLFECGGKKFLFPGDAQIENWQYALSQPEVRELLEDVDFYKVGHHGSLNATPKSLWDLFQRKTSNESEANRLNTAVSTMAGKHGDPDRGTEVPRTKLIKALTKSSNLHNTQELDESELFNEITYRLTSS